MAAYTGTGTGPDGWQLRRYPARAAVCREQGGTHPATATGAGASGSQR